MQIFWHYMENNKCVSSNFSFSKSKNWTTTDEIFVFIDPLFSIVSEHSTLLTFKFHILAFIWHLCS